MMTRTSAQRPLSPQPAHAGAAATGSDSATNVHESLTRTNPPDNGEPPVREKLKKTSITAESQTLNSSTVGEMCVPGSATASTTVVTSPEIKPTQNKPDKERGRLQRKRSFDDVEAHEYESNLSEKNGEDEMKGSRCRKRSKDSEDDRSDGGLEHYQVKSDRSTLRGNVTGKTENLGEKPGTSLEENKSPIIDDKTDKTDQNAAGTGKDDSQHEENASPPKNITAESDSQIAEKKKHITPPPQSDDMQKDELREVVGSPKNKRTRDEFTKDEDGNHLDDEITSSKDESITIDKAKNDEEPKSKRHRDSASPQPDEGIEEKTPLITADTKTFGGFSDKSAASPFTNITGNANNAEKRQSGAIGFASSGFSALASSTVSPFGTLGGSSISSTIGTFGSSTKPDSKVPYATSKTEEKPSEVKAGNITNSKDKLGFASNTGSSSGFGMLGKSPMSGFGSLTSGALTTFATSSSNNISGISDKANKPFGASPDEEEEEVSEAEDDGVKSPQSEDSHPNKRFFAQNVETGEEEEEVVFTCRAKLYNYVKVKENKKEWKERGLGVLKLNRKKPDVEDKNDNSTKARFVMRADGSHRVVLNSPIKKELKFGDPDGKAPPNGYLYFWGSMDGKPQLELLQLKMKQEFASQLYEHVIDLQSTM